MGVVSVSSRAGSGWGLGRVGDGGGSGWGGLRVKSARVGLGSGSSRGQGGVVLGSTPCQVGWGRVRSGSSRGRVGVLLGSKSMQVPVSLRVKSQREAESMAIH